jgi:glycosyltransferase involved in cell wall biosynthesis
VKILFVTDHTYPPHRVGGAESSTHELALTLRERGLEVAVLAALPVAPFGGVPARFLRRMPGYARAHVDDDMGYPVFRSREPTRAVGETLGRFPASAVVVTSGKYTPLSLACLRRGLPTIVYLRDVEAGNIGGALPRERLVTYISNSRFNAARVAAGTRVEPVVIAPLVRPERYRTDTTRTRVVFVNPVPEKGVDLAFRLAAARPDIPFDFVECWPLSLQAREALLARARPLCNVAWHPVTRDSRRLYRHARIVLVPSTWEESWGRVVTEAHCSGIPVLASRRGGLPESVGPGGMLVDHDAPLQHWRAALSRMWDDGDTYEALVASARRHAERREIQPDVLVDRFIAVVTEHVARCRPAAGDVRNHEHLLGAPSTGR